MFTVINTDIESIGDR